MIAREEECQRGGDISEERCPGNTVGSVWRVLGQGKCLQTIKLGLSPLEDPCSSFCLSCLPLLDRQRAWSMLCSFLDTQGQAQKPSTGQACDSSTLSPAFSALSSILDTWLEQYSEDFCQPPFFPCLKLLLSYLVVYMPGSEYEHRVLFLLDQWQHLEPRVTDGKCEETGECGEG